MLYLIQISFTVHWNFNPIWKMQIETAIVVFIIAIAYASIFEWTLHRYVMHRPIKIFGLEFRYPFEKHAKTHHVIFRGDGTYWIQNEEDKWTIPMAWWNGPVLVIVASSPFLIFSSWIFGVAIFSIALYYATYEYLHWCMHLRKNRIIERTCVFRWLDAHHILHHQRQSTNFNVVLPFADWLFGTLYKFPH